MEQITNCKVKYILCGGKWEHNIDMNRRVYDIDYISPTITTFVGGYKGENKREI